jgi:hypothetical protein
MIKYYRITVCIFMLGFLSLDSFSQKFNLPFGDIKSEELSNKPYKPDPGADAIIISDIATATLNYNIGFYVELERDVRIRIVNSNGFDYANIEIPYSTDDNLEGYRASTFNSKNGEKTETIIPKKNFILEKTSTFSRTLKFNFPDVHEGSVIEYSYMIRLDNAVYDLVPWEFQSDIPEVFSSFKISYPEYFIYKNIISGSAINVKSDTKIKESFLFDEWTMVRTTIWYVQDMPAFRDEPYINSTKEHLTGITFELASANLPNSSFKEVTPNYKTLTEKLLERDDFGKPLGTNLKSLAKKITKDKTDDLSRVKKIHEYIATNILWNGVEDFTTSYPLRTILKKEKGNSADINMILIVMLRALNIKADPVILVTRSNGILNQLSAMIQQFNYLVALVTIDGKSYLVDATDPLRPFNELPFECLNETGRLISPDDSRFVDLKNHEAYRTTRDIKISIDPSGKIAGSMNNTYSGYNSYNIRRTVKLESEEGYTDFVKSANSDFNISDLGINNLQDPYSDLILNYNFETSNGAQMQGNEMVFFPSSVLKPIKNPFFSSERRYPIDFGCQKDETFNLHVVIPEGYTISEMPSNSSNKIGNDDAKSEYTYSVTGDELEIKSIFEINKTKFQLSEYKEIRNFYAEYLKKQTEPIVLSKIVNNL